MFKTRKRTPGGNRITLLYNIISGEKGTATKWHTEHKRRVNSKQIGQKETTKKATNTMHNHDNECPEAVVIPLGLAFEGRIGRDQSALKLSLEGMIIISYTKKIDLSAHTFLITFPPKFGLA